MHLKEKPELEETRDHSRNRRRRNEEEGVDRTQHRKKESLQRTLKEKLGKVRIVKIKREQSREPMKKTKRGGLSVRFYCNGGGG